MSDRPDLEEDRTLPILSAARQSTRIPRDEPRYQLLEELARGGMGLVYRAVDPALGRDLALKVLREEYADDPEMMGRFVEEAAVASRLQHPGIVPVHDIGRFSDNRPFFTMKLVEGRTLAALLAQRSDTRDDLPRLLSVFEAICQTMAYAHSRGVLHRDLKPSNVMVGAFGEVQVMDWGLAKLIGGDDEIPPLSPSGFDRSSLADGRPEQTLVGTVVGTPAYMPPEQARGDASTRRVDVFALGGILAEILTGYPPFILPRTVAAWLVARDRDLDGVRDRLQTCGQDADLVALAKTCLSADPADRPADASAVAEGIRSHLSGVQERLRLSELDRAAADARAETALARASAERRARSLLLGLGVVVLLLVALSVATGWRWNERRQATNRRVEILLAQVGQLSRQAENSGDPGSALPLWREAGTLIDHADEVLAAGSADDEVRDGVQREGERIRASIQALTRERRFLDRLAQIRLMNDDENENVDVDVAYRAAFREHDLDLETQTTRDLAERILERPNETRAALVEALDDWCRERRKKLSEGRWRPMLELASELDDNPWRKKVRAELARPLASRVQERYLAVDVLAQLRTPGTLATQLFVSAVESTRRREQLRLLAGSADEGQLTPSNSRLLASLLLQENDTLEAVRVLRLAQKRNPSDLWLNHDLGRAVIRLRSADAVVARQTLDEAIRYLTAARAIKADVGHTLAHALEVRGHKDDAIVLLRELIRLSPLHPGHHACLGAMLIHTGRYDEAEPLMLRAIELDPKVSGYRANLAVCYVHQKRFPLAEKRFREVLVLTPDDTDLHLRLGRLLLMVGREEEGLAHFKRAIALAPQEILPRLELARNFEARGRIEDAVGVYREAIRRHPSSVEPPARLADLFRDKNPEEARRVLREAVVLIPAGERLHERLGDLLMNENQFAEAAVAYRVTLEVNPRNRRAATRLAIATKRMGRIGDSLAYFEEFVRRFPDDANLAYDYAYALSDLGRSLEAERLYRQACALDPVFAEAHCNLGLLLRDQGRFSEALVMLERGHTIGTKRPTWTYPSKEWVAGVKELATIESRLEGILSGKAPATDQIERAIAGRACRIKGLHAGFVQLALEAIALDPEAESNHQRFDRVFAAASAVLAGTGRSRDSAGLSNTKRDALRLRGLTWLKAELEVRRGVAGSRKLFEGWLTNPAFEAVRDISLLARLSADERRSWMSLWDEVRKAIRSE